MLQVLVHAFHCHHVVCHFVFAPSVTLVGYVEERALHLFQILGPDSSMLEQSHRLVFLITRDGHYSVDHEHMLLVVDDGRCRELASRLAEASLTAGGTHCANLPQPTPAPHPFQE